MTLYLVVYKEPVRYTNGHTYIGIFYAKDEDDLKEKVKAEVDRPYKEFNDGWLTFTPVNGNLIEIATEESNYNDY